LSHRIVRWGHKQIPQVLTPHDLDEEKNLLEIYNNYLSETFA
jgi:hypothetical protein